MIILNSDQINSINEREINDYIFIYQQRIKEIEKELLTKKDINLEEEKQDLEDAIEHLERKQEAEFRNMENLGGMIN